MRKLWQRFSLQTRYLVCLRVLPVVLGAILLMGLSSWFVYNNQIVGSAEKSERQHLATIAESLNHRVAQVVMSSELNRLDSSVPSRNPSNGIGNLLQHDLVSAVAEYPVLQDPAPEQTILKLCKSLDNSANRMLIQNWMREQQLYFSPDFAVGSWSQVRARGLPGVYRPDPWNHVLSFSPIFLQTNSDSTNSADNGCQVALMPAVLLSGNRNSDKTSAAVYFLRVAPMLHQQQLAGSWCLLGDDKRILASSVGFPTPGQCLQAKQQDKPEGLLAVITGTDLNEWLFGEPNRATTRLAGSRQGRWTISVLAHRSLPLLLIKGRAVDSLLMSNIIHFSAVIFIAVLALFYSTWLIVRMINRMSLRLQALSGHLENIAAGDYNSQMPTGKLDEVGNLISYFNQMVVSLDQAHRQVKDQAAHLRAALENMRLLDKAKDDFLILISHEVRTPLTSIKGGIDYLKSQIERVPENEKEILERLNVIEITSIIESSSNRLSGFMNDAIQMTTIQSADRELSLDVVPLHELVEIGIERINQRATERNITIENNFTKKSDWWVLCDRAVLKVAFEKIMDNALLHNQDGGRIMVREVKDVPGHGAAGDLTVAEGVRHLMDQPSFVDFENEQLRWRLIEVFNTGAPIPEDRQNALFGKFQLVGRIEHHQKGSGLSLPIAKSAVENHGGQVFLVSGHDDGNSFYMLLPALDGISELPQVRQSRSWNETDECVSSAAGDKKVGQVADPASLKVELDHVGVCSFSDLN